MLGSRWLSHSEAEGERLNPELPISTSSIQLYFLLAINEMNMALGGVEDTETLCLEAPSRQPSLPAESWPVLPD